MASIIKVDTIKDTGSNDIITSDGAGNVTLNTTLDNFTSTGIDDNATSTALTLDSSANLKFNSGYGSVATAYGCRAWVNFDGTGTVSIRGSGNVSSITDNGTGYYIVNFTTSITDANYCVVADSGIGGYRANTDIIGNGNQTVSSSQVITSSTEDGVVRDAVIVSLVVLR